MSNFNPPFGDYTSNAKFTSGAYNPVVTAIQGNYGAANATGRWTKFGNFVFLSVLLQVTDLGTAAIGPIVTLPFKAAAFANFNYTLHGRSNNGGNAVQGVIPENGSSMLVLRYDNADPVAVNQYISVSGWYECVA